MAKKKTKSTKTPAKASAAPTVHAPVGGKAGDSRQRLGLRRVGIAATAAVLIAVVASVVYYRDGLRTASVADKSGPALAVTPAQIAQYVGGNACTECHAQERAAWHGSDHDLAMQVANETAVLGDFGNARFSYAGTTSTFFRRDGKFLVSTDGPDGKLADYEIKYTFGVHPLQQYLIEMPGGRMQALGIAWDSRPREKGGQHWFHLYPGQNIKAGDPLHWTGLNQNWNFQCAECHSTNLRKNFDAKTETFKTTWSELDVSCEACHGPGSNHVAWAKKQGDSQTYGGNKGLAVALDERKGIVWTPVTETGIARRSAPRQSSREIDTCARCHGRASRISDDYVHGGPPLDSHRLALLDDDLYWNDGQMRDEVYNWGSFVQSKMYAQGVTCSDCHDPHSLKLKAQGNAVCAQCHLPTKYDSATHTHHTEGTPGAACAACHMPTTTYMVVDPRHDHSMRIPRPDLSATLGMPNACNNCHSKQSAQWAADAIAKWTGNPPAGFQQFAHAFHDGSVGAPGARSELLAVIDDKSQPALVRASAIDRLGHWITPIILDAVTRSLNDPDAIVRLAAVDALSNTEQATKLRYLPRMLDDPARLVRGEAARALAGPAEQGLTGSQRAAFAHALTDYEALQMYNADRPEGRMGLGNLYAIRGDTGRAIAEFWKAIELDPTFVAAYVNLADLYRAGGTEAEAEATLKQGIARNPRAAALHYTLGLSLVRQKRTEESIKEMRAAVELAPEAARYAYVYAVALNEAGQREEALKVLNTAISRHPYDRDVLSGLAFYQAQAGKQDLALKYAKQLEALDPENEQYAQMAQRIEATPQR